MYLIACYVNGLASSFGFKPNFWGSSLQTTSDARWNKQDHTLDSTLSKRISARIESNSSDYAPSWRGVIITVPKPKNKSHVTRQVRVSTPTNVGGDSPNGPEKNDHAGLGEPVRMWSRFVQLAGNHN